LFFIRYLKSGSSKGDWRWPSSHACSLPQADAAVNRRRAGCTIELFSDADGAGAVYEGTTTAGPAGAWTFGKPDGVAGPNVTATATDSAGNTSEFSAPARALQPVASLPLLLK
jgi:hypothetical protein